MNLTESQIQKQLIQYLTILEHQQKLLFIRNNSGASVTEYFDKKTNRLKKRMIRYGRAGSADIIVFFKDGKTAFIEVKSLNGKQSEVQIQFEKQVEALGHSYYLIRDLSGLITVLNNYIR